MAIDLIAPKDLYLIAGRATAKTSDIIAERSMAVFRDMPHSKSVFVSDTYVNALKNITPTLIEGWNRKGWREGIHYVTDQKPPSHFKRCYKPVQSFKHTIYTYLGTVTTIGSLDQPSGLAGDSFQHRFGDEARLLKKLKLDKLTPALRGEYAQFGDSVFYRGNTFTTDMPNILLGDDDWIMGQEKNMDVEQIKNALQVGLVLNEIKREVLAAIQIKDHKEVDRLKKQLVKWTINWVKVRKNSTFFYVVSSFVNVDILTDGFFEDSLKALGIDEFKSAILSLKVNITKGEKFYGSLGEHHYYDDGIITSYYDKFCLTDTIEESSLALKYIDHNAKLEAGMDFGDMCSIVTAQPRGNYLYCLKEFFTLAPDNEIQMGLNFVEFFKHHKVKVLDLYYDPAGNQNSQTKRDWANAIKNAIEYNNGVATGWRVNLMNVGHASILHETEFNFAKAFMGETTKGLFKLKIDKFQCKCLKSSLELTKIKVKTDRKGSKTIHKDKSTESLPLPSRPMFSTNFSDAFKYLVCRPQWLKLVNNHSGYTGMDPVIGG
jgi:hypothetical protein